jgi:hypothetical protein
MLLPINATAISAITDIMICNKHPSNRLHPCENRRLCNHSRRRLYAESASCTFAKFYPWLKSWGDVCDSPPSQFVYGCWIVYIFSFYKQI